jgi:murein DD-endopeptidase MepM/ murein hydrolase activator NlpD
MAEPVAPAGRGWRILIPVATAAAMLCVGAGVAAAAGGGVSPPSSAEPAAPETGDPSAVPPEGDFKLSAAQATPRKTYFDGRRPPQVTYVFAGETPTDVRIEVVQKGTGLVVDTLVDAAAAPNAPNTVIWDGRGADGALAPDGRYTFRVGNAAGGVAETTADSRFGFYSHRFPVIGRHAYGDGFGAGRNHQGQDVFARCGKKVVAARGGRVQHNKVHSAAGNYLVIDGKGTGVDHMYAHLESRSPLPPGTRVRTGQEIGRVGDTGNATGCHLHFEAWSAPGWYEGGRALPSVRGLLKTWDSWS